jgi:hypothetical protein
MSIQEKIDQSSAEELDPIRVRVGTPADVHEAMEVALLACEENALSRPNPQKLLQDIWSALNLAGGIVGIIGEPGGLVEGIVVLRIGSLWYSDDMTIEERAIYVREGYRSAKGGRARKLCEFSMRCSDELGVPLTIGILSSARTEAKVRLYTRALGKPSGAYWIYNGRTGHPGNEG